MKFALRKKILNDYLKKTKINEITKYIEFCHFINTMFMFIIIMILTGGIILLCTIIKIII